MPVYCHQKGVIQLCIVLAPSRPPRSKKDAYKYSQLLTVALEAHLDESCPCYVVLYPKSSQGRHRNPKRKCLSADAWNRSTAGLAHRCLAVERLPLLPPNRQPKPLLDACQPAAHLKQHRRRWPIIRTEGAISPGHCSRHLCSCTFAVRRFLCLCECREAPLSSNYPLRTNTPWTAWTLPQKNPGGTKHLD